METFGRQLTGSRQGVTAASGDGYLEIVHLSTSWPTIWLDAPAEQLTRSGYQMSDSSISCLTMTQPLETISNWSDAGAEHLYFQAAQSAPSAGPNRKGTDVVGRSTPNRSSTVEKYYALARTYGEKYHSRGDRDLWHLIEQLRRCSTVDEARGSLCAIMHKAGQNSMRRHMVAMDKHYGTTSSICPRCGNRYKQHHSDGRCLTHQSFVTDPSSLSATSANLSCSF